MSSKILSKAPTDLELAVGKAFTELEASPEFKNDLKTLQFKSAREIEVSGGKKAVVVFVPFPSLNAYHKIQVRLATELEKKLPDNHVIFLAERRIVPKPARKSRKEQKRPRSRTLTSVQDKILDDLVFPTEITGKRVRYAVGGARVQKVFLKNKDSSAVEHKLDSFQAVYKKLTGKDVVFEIEGEN
ncbi:ribosomal protein S7A [Hanseniaspora valbyensis]|uniref:40S ribosomal protein S7 n=1 Tax=Hanseniaspora valbyensis NRRL Y-1626 TaxID=766949 RepID=A0A1B7TDV2_9ASCO|nr:40S ribosomal protein S7-A [Hanseniaspora valbyensis NRRL Y-1626]